jgi:two-component sensor histidine kinase
MITGLVELKSISSTSRESTKMLEELAMRVQSISELYRLLYESDTRERVNMANYCRVISESIVGISDEINLKANFDDVFIGTKYATSLGLIQVELLYNIMKYAFPDNRPGKMVKIGLISETNKITLKVSDNGIGLPADFNTNKSGSSGLGLVQLLAGQLSGTVQFSSGEQGTEVTVTIPANQSDYA